jgi:uncharacterized oxidoreductase
MKTSNNTILITGGATGIGFALAKAFLEAGNNVIICGRRENRLKEAQAKLPKLHIKVCDVSKESDRENLLNWAQENFPGLNILVNNAGVQKSINLEDAKDVYRRSKEEIGINLIAPIHLSSLFIPLLSKHESSAIINITSGLAFSPLAIYPVYCATKAAMHSFSMSLRYRLAKTSVRVFEVAPPLVQTELKVPADNGHPEMNAYGITTDLVTEETLKALSEDNYEIAIGQAAGMREKRDGLFAILNPPGK